MLGVVTILTRSRRRPQDDPLPALPIELIYAILDLLPSPTAWLCRRVCRTWCRYIEEHVARSWLNESRIIVTFWKDLFLFRIYIPREGEYTRKEAVTFPCVGRDGRYLVYALDDWQSRLTVPRPPWPYLHPLAYLEYSRELTAQQPIYIYHLQQSCINMFVTHIADGYHNGPVVKLRTKWHPRVLQGAKPEGFKFLMEENKLLVDWRVLYSSMFSARTQQWGMKEVV